MQNFKILSLALIDKMKILQYVFQYNFIIAKHEIKTHNKFKILFIKYDI